MKRETTALTHPSIGLQLGLFVKNIGSAVHPYFGKISKNMSAIILNMHVSRMTSVLQSMNDRQLEEIGITRAEISKYANMLIRDEDC